MKAATSFRFIQKLWVKKCWHNHHDRNQKDPRFKITAKDAPTNCRSLNNPSGIIGAAVRLSTRINNTNAINTMPINSTTGRLSQPQSLPLTKTSVSDNSIPIESNIPHTSILGLVTFSAFIGSNIPHEIMTNITSGILMKKIYRHPKYWVTTPTNCGTKRSQQSPGSTPKRCQHLSSDPENCLRGNSDCHAGWKKRLRRRDFEYPGQQSKNGAVVAAPEKKGPQANKMSPTTYTLFRPTMSDKFDQTEL